MKTGEYAPLHHRLFPQLVKSKWGKIDINDIAIDLNKLLAPMLKMLGKNPFLDPYVCEQWKEFIHKIKEIDYSWGGYLEDRSTIWKGHYHAEGVTTHVGVDYYVPTGTEVHLPVDAVLMDCAYDPDPCGGWGGKLIFTHNNGHFLLGHLKEIVAEPGKRYKAGDVIGVVAEPEKNGGWSPHLHVQCMREYNPDVDGYLSNYSGIEKDYPNPETTL